jgi:hypothetical protein
MPNAYSGRSRTPKPFDDAGGGYFVGFFPFVKPVFLRMDSPFNVSRWALCTSRSQMESATVASPMAPCHCSVAS